MQAVNMFIILLLIVFIAGCSSTHTPAPVTSLTYADSLSSRKIIIRNNRYTVQKGDTLFAIAFTANRDVRTIAALNNIKPPYTIFPGQKLVLAKPKTRNKKSTPRKVVKTETIDKKQKNNNLVKKDLAKPKQREYVQKQATQKVNTAASKKNGKIDWQWPAQGQITKRFSNKEQGYKGLQIKNKLGTSVSAAAAGTVVYAGSALRGYGNLIILKHSDDYLSAYAHNDRLLVREQQKVKAGQKIAEMGNTDATQTALRFEIRFKGQAVNPKKYLP
ncbi:peptidoglycan-binding protein [Pseudoalteromonas phenolica]|uniref:Peptidoglycan-binding protein n=1 Tax=Pseudoalteromonas phenolica TaxID=161398 RepID=A0A5R9Q6V0_9GAMM|nr:peptidoglycan DD-metalloendopeptidase family protein [Pseudoalteromonas phenolica]TLX48870.1 peptidoglycan-binding protein [Pseudoalteromonas phenolica]